MADTGFETTKQDVARAMHDESNKHPGGNIPAGSDAATLQSMIDSDPSQKSKAEIIEERKANLPLPEQPPVPSDFNSGSATAVNVGSGGVSDTFSTGNDALREPATGDSAVRTDGETYGTNTLGQGVGREAVEGAIPNDAVARGSKDKAGLADTTGKDYGYPQKSDPANTSELP